MLTLVTSWYIVKSKFNVEIYQSWIKNMLSNVNNYKLVIFTNNESKWVFEPYIRNNPNIEVKIVEWEEFYGYKYYNDWIENHKHNYLLNITDWKLNMLWNEKIHFVKRVIEERTPLKNEWYGWCDIGYFRGNKNDMRVEELVNWPSSEKVESLNKSKIYYAIVCSNRNMNALFRLISHKNEYGLPVKPIPSYQNSVAGGFFLIHKDKINWWHATHYGRLEKYFQYKYLVKDDQILLIDNICSNFSHFELIREPSSFYCPWFAFQRFLI